MATLSCLYKHWGFHEEREVRIVVIPPNEELIRDGRAAGELRPTRPRNMFIRGGTPVPYLDLFAQDPRGEKSRLPQGRGHDFLHHSTGGTQVVQKVQRNK